MLVLVVVAVAAAQCFKSVSAGEMDHYIHVRSSIDNTTEVANNGILNVSKQKSGYILCNASAVSNSFNATTYYWDYSVKWEMPKEVQNDSEVFQMGKDYQMPHAYLVFKKFKPIFKGSYQCQLLFHHTRIVGSHVIQLSLSLDGSTH